MAGGGLRTPGLQASVWAAVARVQALKAAQAPAGEVQAAQTEAWRLKALRGRQREAEAEEAKAAVKAAPRAARQHTGRRKEAASSDAAGRARAGQDGAERGGGGGGGIWGSGGGTTVANPKDALTPTSARRRALQAGEAKAEAVAGSGAPGAAAAVRTKMAAEMRHYEVAFKLEQEQRNALRRQQRREAGQLSAAPRAETHQQPPTVGGAPSSPPPTADVRVEDIDPEVASVSCAAPKTHSATRAAPCPSLTLDAFCSQRWPASCAAPTPSTSASLATTPPRAATSSHRRPGTTTTAARRGICSTQGAGFNDHVTFDLELGQLCQ